MSDIDWESHFKSLAPSAAPPVPQTDGTDWDSHFTSMAPKPSETTSSDSSSVPQMTGAKRYPMLAGQAVGRSLEGLVGLPGTLEKILPNNLLSNPNFDPNNQMFPTPEDIDKKVNKLTGVSFQNNPDLVPQNAGERYGVAAAETLPTIAGLVASGGMSAVPAITTSLAGAFSAQAAHDLKPDSPWLPIVAGIVGSMGTGWATSGIKGAIAASNANKKYTAAIKQLDDLDRESFVLRDPSLQSKPASLTLAENKLTTAKDAQFAAAHPGEVPPPTGNQLALASAQDAVVTGRQEATQLADQVKVASRKELDAARQLSEDSVAHVNQQVQGHFESVADSVGKASTLDEAGTSLQSAARNWVSKVLPKKMAAASKDLDAAVPGETEVPLGNFAGAYSAIDKKALINGLDLSDTMLARAKQVLGLEPVEGAEEAASRNAANALFGEETEAPAAQPLTWKEARQLRTALGDALARPKIVSAIGEQNVKQLYSALTADLGSVAKQAGAEDLWNGFNEESTRLHSIAAGPMSKLISTVNEGKEISLSPAQAAGAMISAGRKGGTELATLRGEIPDAVNDLSSLQLRSPQAWGKLSPEAREALLPDAEQRVQLESSLGAKAQASEAAKAEFKAATQKYNDTVTAANTGAKEGNFSRLREVRAQQKVVEAERQAAAQKAAAEDLARAKQMKEAQDAVDSAREAHAAEQAKANYEMEKRLKGKKEAVEQAKAALPQPKPNPLQVLAENKRAIIGGAILGNELVPGLVTGTGLSPLQIGTGALVGAAVVPPLWNAVKATVRDPRLLGVPAAGFIGGQNALTSPAPK